MNEAETGGSVLRASSGLEKGRFSWPGGDEQSARVTLTHEELSLLLVHRIINK